MDAQTIETLVRHAYVASKNGRPDHEVREYVASSLGLNTSELYLYPDRAVSKEELDRIWPGIERLSLGEPLAYIQEKKEFYGYEFDVCPDVLIPRPETEILVDVACFFLKEYPCPGTIVDVCTGSGCVGIVLKLLFPKWHVILLDISEKALHIASKNAKKLHADVEVIQGNLLEPVLSRSFSCVVSNPPYLTTQEWNESDVKQHEPRLALDGGVHGLDIYEQLLQQIGVCTPEFVALEIGRNIQDLVMRYTGKKSSLHTDLFGRDRVVSF